MDVLLEPLGEPVWWAALGPLLVLSMAMFGALGSPSTGNAGGLLRAVLAALGLWLLLTPVAGVFADRVLSGG